MTIASKNPKVQSEPHTVRRYLKDTYGGLYIVNDARTCWELWNGGKGGWPSNIPLRSVVALTEKPYEASDVS